MAKKVSKNYLKIALGAIILSVVGVYVVDYFSHLLFSDPMETVPYFLAKATLFLVFSFIFLAIMNLKKKEFVKVLVAGLIVASLWGFYYNILPEITGYYPFGIALAGLSFLGMGLIGTGIAFGIVHTLAFVCGYYVQKFVFEKIK